MSVFYGIDLLFRNFDDQINKENAHRGYPVTSLCEIKKHRIASASQSDSVIKIWNLPSISNELTLVASLSGNTKGVDRIISLTKNRLASVSVKEQSIKIWDCLRYSQINVPYENKNSSSPVIQLIKNEEIIVFNTNDNGKKMNLSFYQSIPPYELKGQIKNMKVEIPNGLCEMSNGNVIVCKRGTIHIIDPVRYEKISKITLDNCLVTNGNSIFPEMFISIYGFFVFKNDSILIKCQMEWTEKTFLEKDLIFYKEEILKQFKFVDGKYKCCFEKIFPKSQKFVGNLLLNDGRIYIESVGYEKGSELIAYRCKY